MAVKSSQAPCGPGIPELDLVIFRPRNQQSLCRMPITRLHVPIVPGQCSVASHRRKIPNLQGRVVRCRRKLGIAGRPRKIPNRVMVPVLDCLDVVKIRPPVFDITLLPTGDQPVMTMRP